MIDPFRYLSAIMLTGTLVVCPLARVLSQDEASSPWQNETVSYVESGFYGSPIGPVRKEGGVFYAAIRDRVEIWEEQTNGPPKVVGSINVGARIENLIVDQSIVYLSVEDDRLCIVDAGDRLHPRICSANKLYCAPALRKIGNYVVCVRPEDAGNGVSLGVIDVAQSNNPFSVPPQVQLEASEDEASDGYIYCRSFCIVNNTLFIMEWYSPQNIVSKYDLMRPWFTPEKQWKWDENTQKPKFSIVKDRLSFSIDPNTTEDLGGIDEIQQLFADEGGGVYMEGFFDQSFSKYVEEKKLSVDLSDWLPREPDAFKKNEFTGVIPYPIIRNPSGVVVGGDHAVVTDGHSLFVLDVTHVETPKLLAQIQPPESISQMELRQGLLFLQGRATRFVPMKEVLNLAGKSDTQELTLSTVTLANDTIGMTVGDQYCICWKKDASSQAFEIKFLPTVTPLEFMLPHVCKRTSAGNYLFGITCQSEHVLEGLDVRDSKELNLVLADVGTGETYEGRFGGIVSHEGKILVSGPRDGLIESAAQLYDVDSRGALNRVTSFDASGAIAMAFDKDHVVLLASARDTQVASQNLLAWNLHADKRVAPTALYENSMLKFRRYHPLTINQMAIQNDLLYVADDSQGLMFFHLP